ncbi:MAG TPA: hypothetical protein VHA75_03735, partial [Rugosimonospora sp.]|nr:hypothetical protein [Rugosimonospora sp.]
MQRRAKGDIAPQTSPEQIGTAGSTGTGVARVPEAATEAPPGPARDGVPGHRPPGARGRWHRGVTTRPEATPLESLEDTELDEPLPDAERLIADAIALAGDDLDSAQLVRRYWRFAPDEELVGLTPQEMLAAARAHRELAEQRVPGELKLRVGETPDGELTTLEIVTDDMPFLVDTVT